MEALKPILLKGLAFAAVLVGLNFLYRYTLYPKEVAAELEEMPKIEALNDGYIVYYGESSNSTYADQDLDKGSISDFLQPFYPGLRVRGLTFKAAHAGVYRDLLPLLPSDPPQRSIVVTMTLRSFGQQWIYSRLETSLQKRMLLLGPGPALYRRLLLSFRGYEIHSEKEWMDIIRTHWREDTFSLPGNFPHHNIADWDSALAKEKIKRPDGQVDWDATALATHYVKAYGFLIDTLANPRIADFDALVHTAQARGWNIVFALIPEDVARAEALCGAPLAWMMRHNRDLLVNRYRRMGATVVDLLEFLPSSAFIDQNWTTEHYFEEGRRAIADSIAGALRAFHPAAYKAAKWVRGAGKTYFFNDMEGKTQWSQMHTAVPGRAHSGKLACKVGGKEKFSVTWTADVKNMDTSALDSVDVNLWLYQEGLDHYAGVAVEASGDSTGYLWDTTGLRRYTHVTGEWVQVRMRLPLWPNTGKAQVVKLYVYNPSEKDIWIDDLGIQFK
jgi:hypothetical protein